MSREGRLAQVLLLVLLDEAAQLRWQRMRSWRGAAKDGRSCQRSGDRSCSS